MVITINSKDIEVLNGETLLEAARRTGHHIPSLCYAKGAKHKSSCMVCAVKNCATGQLMPSCTTYPAEGLNIETDTEEVRSVRSLSLELLLSDHRADCEAPCSLVCPKGLDVERMLGLYDAGLYKEAYMLLVEAFGFPEASPHPGASPLSGAFPFAETGCGTCKAPCEKACRRGTVDKAVPIRAIIKEIAAMFAPGTPGSLEKSNHEKAAGMSKPEPRDMLKNTRKADKNIFQSRLGRFTPEERERLKVAATTASGCLHCACAGRNDCKLREYATAEGIKRPRYDASSALAAMDKIHVTGNMWFEQAKCIRCGLCVYNSKNGFTFRDRGFGMQVILPDENKGNISEGLAGLCPTGALYLVKPYAGVNI